MPVRKGILAAIGMEAVASALDPVAVWWVVCWVGRQPLRVFLTYFVVRGVDTKSRVRVEGWILFYHAVHLYPSFCGPAWMSC